MIRLSVLLAVLAAPLAAREGAQFRCVLTQSCLSDSPCDAVALEMKVSLIGPFYIDVNDTLVWGMVETYAEGTTVFFGWNNRLQPHHVALEADGRITYTFGQMNREFPESVFGGLFRGTCQESRF